MANRLKIYACSGIGETPVQDYTYWTDNTNTVENTQAVNTLLVGINTFYTELKYLNIDKEDKIWLLNQIDLYTVCLEAAKRYNKHYSTLQKAGKVIGAMVKRGDFEFDELNESKRDEHLDKLIEAAQDEWESDLKIEDSDPEFDGWWNENIVLRNQVGLDAAQQDTTRKALAKGVKGLGKVDESWKDNEDISQYLTKAGTYFLYLFFTDEQLAKLPNVFKVKRAYQTKIYNYCKGYFVDVYGSEEEMQDIIRNGIIQEFKETPEALCEGIASGKKKGIGSITLATTMTITELISILTIVAGVIASIITAICDCVYKSNVKKYEAMSKATIDGGVPEASDCDGLNLNGSKLGKKSDNKWLWIAGGVAALLLLRN